MIEVLNMVKLAVATKNLIPILTHLHFYDGRVQSNNGRTCVDAPLNIGYNVTVPAMKFIQASRLCSSNLKLNLTKTGKLTVSCNKFRAILQTAEHDDFPRIEINKENAVDCEHLLHFLKPLVPFISEDASRPWSMSILIRGGYAWATNNIAIARVQVPYDWEATISRQAVLTLLEIESTPTSIVIEDNYVAFLYEGDVWLRSTSLATQWPAVEHLVKETDPPPLPNFFKESLEAMKVFCEDPKLPIFLLGEQGIKTNEDEQGSMVELASFPKSKFRAEPLLQVAGVASHIDFENYPNPCYFKSSIGIDGVIIGVK